MDIKLDLLESQLDELVGDVAKLVKITESHQQALGMHNQALTMLDDRTEASSKEIEGLQWVGGQLNQLTKLRENDNACITDLIVRIEALEQRVSEQNTQIKHLSTDQSSLRVVLGNAREKIIELQNWNEAQNLIIDKIIETMVENVTEIKKVGDNHAKWIKYLNEKINSLGEHLNGFIDNTNSNFQKHDGTICELVELLLVFKAEPSEDLN